MTPHELLALALVVSVLASGAAWCVGTLIERGCDDPRLRDTVWGAGLGLSLLPVLAIFILLLTPAPVREVAATVAPSVMVETVAAAPTPVMPEGHGASLPPGAVAWAILAGAGLAALVRLGVLAMGAVRLARLIARTAPADAALRDRVRILATRLQVRPPLAVVSATTSEALLSGLGRPRLILPAANPSPADAVIAHELAHLKRRDHFTLWLEETVSVVLAFNPLIPLLRARRDAAREEACDALALSDASPEIRRAYAQTLIDALRSRAAPSGARVPEVALTFTGAGRTTAMHRLKAIATPAAPAAARTRLIAASAALGLVATIASASWAVAAQRPIETIFAEAPDAPSAGTDFAYVEAALTPIYRAAWPTACGFGIENGDTLIVHAGDCATGPGSKIEILALNGVGVLGDTRAAFETVRAACEAGRPVEIAFAENGARGSTRVACSAPAETPAEPVRFTVALSYDPAIRIATGDRLEIELNRNVDDKGGTASTSIVLDLAPGTLPRQAFAELRPPLLPDDLRAGAPFTLSAKIFSVDGTIKAVSDRERGRPFAPYISTQGAISTAMRMLPADIPAAQASPVGLADGPALTVQVAQADHLVLGSRSTLRLAMETPDDDRGARNVTTLDIPIAPGEPLGRQVRFPLKDNQLPTLTRGRVYGLTASISDADGRVLYAADPVTVRMGAGSRGQLAGMRPELVLARTAVASPSAVAPRTYQARLTIREAGQIVAAGRMRVLPDGSATTVLNADGREYQFDLALEGPASDPESRGRLTARADVARTAPAGGWERVARPVLLMAQDGHARMTWGDEAGLLFEIVVEPA